MVPRARPAPLASISPTNIRYLQNRRTSTACSTSIFVFKRISIFPPTFLLFSAQPFFPFFSSPACRIFLYTPLKLLSRQKQETLDLIHKRSFPDEYSRLSSLFLPISRRINYLLLPSSRLYRKHQTSSPSILTENSAESDVK